jgi:hypothetical protein
MQQQSRRRQEEVHHLQHQTRGKSFVVWSYPRLVWDWELIVYTIITCHGFEQGVIIQGSNRSRNANTIDLGAEYAKHIGRKLQRYELSDTRACQLLVTTHAKNFWVVPAPEAFSRHSGTCRLLGDRKHPPATHTLQVGDFLRVGSVGVVVIETHDGTENRVLSEEKIQKIMKDTTNSNGGFLDLQETDGGRCCDVACPCAFSTRHHIHNLSPFQSSSVSCFYLRKLRRLC